MAGIKLYPPDHVFDYVPRYLDNRSQLPENQIVIGLKVVPSPEQQAYGDRKAINLHGGLGPERATEENRKLAKETLKSKITYFRGLEDIGITGESANFDADFERFLVAAPPDMVEEISQAVWSSQFLTRGDQQNFLPAAASPSGSDSETPTRTAATPARKKSA